ncbi:MAG: 50S ribosomal protein L35 [Phycisphaerae bacterium]
MKTKQKPHKGLLKRVRVSARGKIVRSKMGKVHLMSAKTSTRRRKMRRWQEVGGALGDNLRRAIGVTLRRPPVTVAADEATK